MVKDILAIKIRTGYFLDDITALQARSIPDSERFTTPATTPGFRYVREPGQGLSIGLRLEIGETVWGDALGVAYGGKAGRAALFTAAPFIDTLPRFLKKTLPQKPQFREGMKQLFPAIQKEFPEHALALSFGISQAFLRSCAKIRRLSPAQLIQEEWGLQHDFRPVALHAQCGDNFYQGAEKMMALRLDSLPHGLVDNISEQLGENGEKLLSYVNWLSQRIREFSQGTPYSPVIHLDVHGAIGKIFQQDLVKIDAYLRKLKEQAAPFALRMESVLVRETFSEQQEAYRLLRQHLQGSGIELVIDEWANTFEDIQRCANEKVADMIHIKMPDLGGVDQTIEAILACQKAGVKTLLGGSCNETELSAELTAHIAVATQPDVVLAKPGMGISEGVEIIGNTMQRIWAESKL